MDHKAHVFLFHLYTNILCVWIRDANQIYILSSARITGGRGAETASERSEPSLQVPFLCKFREINSIDRPG